MKKRPTVGVHTGRDLTPSPSILVRWRMNLLCALALCSQTTTVSGDLTLLWSIMGGIFSKRGRQRQRWEARKIFLSNPYILLSLSSLWLGTCFYFRWDYLDSSVSFWTKRWTLFLEMSVTFCRRRGNGAVEVSFDSRTARMRFLSCVIRVVLPTFRRRPRLFCLSSLVRWSVKRLCT